MFRGWHDFTRILDEREKPLVARAKVVSAQTLMTYQEAFHFVQIGLTPDEEQLAIEAGTSEGSGHAILGWAYRIRVMREWGDE